jgi:Bacterial PH domain
MGHNAGYSLALGLVVAGLVGKGVTDTRDWPWLVVGALLGLAVAWRFVRALRAGIGADAGGLTIRSVFGPTRTLPWSDIRGFELVRSQGGTSVAVVCRDGRRLFSSGCTFVRWPGNWGSEKMDALLRALEAERAADGAA